jgi:quinoprotein relay system zinc metallohydrolase 1
MLCSVAALQGPGAMAQQLSPNLEPGRVDAVRLDYRLQPRLIATDTWVIEGAVADFSRANGCNIINTGFIATPEGTLVINTGTSRLYGEQQRAAIRRSTPYEVVEVLNLNLHPDYFLGNQAWQDVPTRALAGTIAGQRAEGKAYEDNLFRLCGDWMKGSEHRPATQPIEPGTRKLGGHRIELLHLSGHTADDLVLIDHDSSVLFAGGLVFADRVPTTPHADLERWLASLDRIEQLVRQHGIRTLVPSHGPVQHGLAGVGQTRDWLQWLQATLRHSAEQGLDLSEVIRLSAPTRFASWAAQPAEYIRSVHQLYPAYERQALGGTSVTTQ